MSAIQDVSGDTSKTSLLGILPKETVMFTRNAFLGVKHIREFYEKAQEVYKTLHQDIKYSEPKAIFVSEEEFLNEINHFLWADFASEVLKSSRAEIQLKLTQQPVLIKILSG